MDFIEIIIKDNKEAAEILDQLDEDDIADILINISDEKAAGIYMELSRKNPAKAKEVMSELNNEKLACMKKYLPVSYNEAQRWNDIIKYLDIGTRPGKKDQLIYEKEEAFRFIKEQLYSIFGKKDGQKIFNYIQQQLEKGTKLYTRDTGIDPEWSKWFNAENKKEHPNLYVISNNIINVSQEIHEIIIYIQDTEMKNIENPGADFIKDGNPALERNVNNFEQAQKILEDIQKQYSDIGIADSYIIDFYIINFKEDDPLTQKLAKILILLGKATAEELFTYNGYVNVDILKAKLGEMYSFSKDKSFNRIKSYPYIIDRLLQDVQKEYSGLYEH